MSDPSGSAPKQITVNVLTEPPGVDREEVVLREGDKISWPGQPGGQFKVDFGKETPVQDDGGKDKLQYTHEHLKPVTAKQQPNPLKGRYRYFSYPITVDGTKHDPRHHHHQVRTGSTSRFADGGLSH